MQNNQGVYKNARLMHVCTTIVGSTVYLQTKDGSVWEGIFKTFDPKFTICLAYAVQIDPKLGTKDCFYQALKNGSKVREQAFFDLENIVRIAVIDFDLNYATKDSTLDKLATDSDISKFNPTKPGEHRELETWQDDDGDNTVDDSLLSLDDHNSHNKNGGKNNSRGWDAHEMFKYNEKVHKVNSTYNEKLEDYTIALNEQNSSDWQSRHKRASAIAKEIEANPKSLNRLAKEDGSDDEEEKFSAVVRPVQQSSQSKQQKPQQQQSQQQSQQHQQTSQPPVNQHSQQPVSQQSLPQNQQHQPSQPQHQHPSQHHHHREPQQHQNQHTHHHMQNNGPPSHQRPLGNRLNYASNNQNLRPRFDRARIDSLKNFGKQLNITPQPGHGHSPSSQQHQPQHHQHHQPHHSPHQQPQHQAHQQSHQHPHQQSNQQHNQSHHHHQQQQQTQPTQPAPPPTQTQQQSHQQSHQQQQQPHQPAPSQASHQPPTQSQTQPQQQHQQQPQPQPQPQPQQPQHQQQSQQQQIAQSPASNQTEIAKKSTLNPNAKEFKPRSPASSTVGQSNGATIIATAPGMPPTLDPANSSPMSQPGHESYYQQVPMFPHGLSPNQQQHHAAQFIPNHAPMPFQSPIPYPMQPGAMNPHYPPTQQMPPRGYVNYHHRAMEPGHHNAVRVPYTQASMVPPTSSGGQVGYVYFYDVLGNFVGGQYSA